MPSFSNFSLQRLESCDPLLILLFNEIVKHFDCRVLEGHRSRTMQLALYEEGKTKVKFSKHNYSPSLAVDVAPYPIDWNDTPRFYMFGGYVLGTADQMGVAVRWGGDWDGDKETADQNFMDLVHFELVSDVGLV
jgi:peptidoglycan L-alanyl-D-glutamate endopeptidase CwlK